MNEIKSLAKRGAVLIGMLCFLLFVVWFYLNDISQFFDFCKSIGLISVPLFLISEVIISFILEKRVNEDIEVLAKRHQILSYYEYILEKNLVYKYLDSFLYTQSKSSIIMRANCELGFLQPNIVHLGQIDDVLKNSEAIVAAAPKGKARKRVKKYIKNLQKANPRYYGIWFIEEARLAKSGRLFLSKEEKPLNIFAFALTIVSLVITLLVFLGINWTWWHIGYFAIPAGVEIVSYFSIRNKISKEEVSYLNESLKELNLIKTYYEKRYEEAKLIKKGENNYFIATCNHD